MPLNPYFNFRTQANEQNLLDDLIIESIQIYGVSAKYIRRENADLDRLFGEDELAKYTDAQEIELYMKSITQWGGAGTFLQKFGGIINEDQVTFIVAMKRFEQVFNGTLSRPREGDILYLDFFGPAWRYLFEIRYVNSTEQLFQLGRLYTYELKCESMSYSHERVTTTDAAVNRVAQREAYAIQIQLDAGSGTYYDGETVYQGRSFIDAIATGMVGVDGWKPDTKLLSVINVTGEFANSLPVIGTQSGASYTPLVAPTPSPKNLEPTELDISDHDLLDAESPSVVTPSVNPRYKK